MFIYASIRCVRALGRTFRVVVVGAVLFLALGVPASSAPWMPDGMSGLALWLDAADDDSFTLGTGNLVTGWNDKSGNERHASPGPHGGAPTYSVGGWNGNDVVTFSGAQQLSGDFDVTLTEQTVFAVATRTGGSGAQRFFTQNSASGRDFDGGKYLPVLHNGGTISSYIGSHRAVVSQGVSEGEWLMVTNHHSGTQLSNQVNGGVAATYNHNLNYDVATYGLGHTLGWANDGQLTGAIAEVIVFDTSLSTDERQMIEGYLAHKWWDTDQVNPLPPEHPYYRSEEDVTVISLDFDHGGLGTKSGMEPGGFLGEIGGLWNSLPVAQSAKAGPLQTGDGSPTLFDVTFEFVDGTDSYRTYASSGDVLRGDVVFLQSGTDQVGPLDWEIAGLMPGLAYDLKFFGQMQDGSPNNAATFLVDGYDSIFTDDVATFLSVPADTEGKITGSLLHETGTHSAWSGLQIRGVFVPEPSTGLLAVLAVAGSLLFRSRRRRR